MLRPKQGLLALLALVLATALRATAPLIADVPDQVIAQNTSTGSLPFVIGDAETTFTALTVTASSSNASLVPNTSAALLLGGANAQRTLAVTPVAGATGATTITLTITDGENRTASSTFTVTVTAPNTPPTLGGLVGYQLVTAPAGASVAPDALAFTVGDAETAPELLIVTATSSNPVLVPTSQIVLGGAGANRTVRVTPVVGVRGSAVITLRVTDPLGASARGEFAFVVFDPASANNAIRQPRGLYVLDSAAGTQLDGVSMRDANIRNLPFLDGYVLRTDWAMLEPTEGAFDFRIIDNLFAKLPAQQKLSLIVTTAEIPAWVFALPGLTTWTAGTPAVTAPQPWDPIAQERFRRFLVALGDHLVDGVPLRAHPRLAVINASIPGLKSGVRDPTELRIRDIPGYTRAAMTSAVLTHLANVTDNFPATPVQLGFWTYTDATASPAPWEELRTAILARFDGVSRPRVGFWMENLAANRADSADPDWTGLPNTTYTAPLFLSQENAFVGYQMLGSWARPFSSSHVDNNLNGTPEDAMDYAFNTFQTRYHEVYQADVDFAPYAAELQRWHDLFAALPVPALTLAFGSSQGGTTLSLANGATLDVTLNATGGTAPLTWTLAGGALPAGLTLSANGVLGGTSTQAGLHTFTVLATDATGAAASQTYTLTIAAAPAGEAVFAATITRNADATLTLTWPAVVGGWYQIEVSEDLVEWTAPAAATQATQTTMTWTDDGTLTGSPPTAAARRFYRVRDWGVFQVSFVANTFTYTDATRTVSGVFVKPAGSGRFPALIINHGTGGSAAGFSQQRANEMSPWGLACIGANLTHQQGATEDFATWGYSPENLARIRACLAALATRADVDVSRVAMWGHSRGAFATIGAASALGAQVDVIGVSAGGIVDDTDASETTYPAVAETLGLVASTLLFHGSTDAVVPPENSQRLATLLTTLGVPNERVVYDTSAIASAGSRHNLHQAPEIYADILVRWRAWLTTHGVLP